MDEGRRQLLIKGLAYSGTAAAAFTAGAILRPSIGSLVESASNWFGPQEESKPLEYMFDKNVTRTTIVEGDVVSFKYDSKSRLASAETTQNGVKFFYEGTDKGFRVNDEGIIGDVKHIKFEGDGLQLEQLTITEKGQSTVYRKSDINAAEWHKVNSRFDDYFLGLAHILRNDPTPNDIRTEELMKRLPK